MSIIHIYIKNYDKSLHPFKSKQSRQLFYCCIWNKGCIIGVKFEVEIHSVAAPSNLQITFPTVEISKVKSIRNLQILKLNKLFWHRAYYKKNSCRKYIFSPWTITGSIKIISSGKTYRQLHDDSTIFYIATKSQNTFFSNKFCLIWWQKLRLKKFEDYC